ncbi:hypothetical protein EDB89DRAFT_1904250 [Lactarius sanguifluus]|nr:hypothetical protein EDB89DRAFT_1904250 [Lactarius sanguifluus]
MVISTTVPVVTGLGGRGGAGVVMWHTWHHVAVVFCRRGDNRRWQGWGRGRGTHGAVLWWSSGSGLTIGGGRRVDNHAWRWSSVVGGDCGARQCCWRHGGREVLHDVRHVGVATMLSQRWVLRITLGVPSWWVLHVVTWLWGLSRGKVLVVEVVDGGRWGPRATHAEVLRVATTWYQGEGSPEFAWRVVGGGELVWAKRWQWVMCGKAVAVTWLCDKKKNLSGCTGPKPSLTLATCWWSSWLQWGLWASVAPLEK